MFARFWKILTSLKLTVVCLAVSLVLVFVGTLAQVEQGLYITQDRFFKSFLIFWYPSPGGFGIPVFPGGYLVGGILLANLLAAHFKRFKFTKKKTGIFMIHAGLILLLLGQLFTDLLSTESAMPLFEGESKNYSEDFRAKEVAIIDSSRAAYDQVISIPEAHIARLGEIRHEQLPVAIRVKSYWPNCTLFDRAPDGAVVIDANQGAYTNHVLYASTHTGTARQAAPAVLVEPVAAGESLGKWLVKTESDRRRAPEQFVAFREKQWPVLLISAPMLGGLNLVLMDPERSGMDRFVSFGESELRAGAELTDDALPFSLKIHQYWPNGRLYHKPSEHAVAVDATRGVYNRVTVEPLPLATAMDDRSLPAALVELVAGSGSLGTWLLPVGYTSKQTFAHDGTDFEIAFRFLRHHKPFSVTLLKATHENYQGTDKPKNFASRVRLHDPEIRESREVRIYMNHPLRYRGYTFFQHQMAADSAKLQPGQMPSSTFQVVRNPTWLTPYFACVIVGAGLLVQFLTHLLSFVAKRRRAAAPGNGPQPSVSNSDTGKNAGPRNRKRREGIKPVASKQA